MRSARVQRPAEFAALTASVVVLLAYLFGIDEPGVLAALTVCVGALPGVVTWCVELAARRSRRS